jgi:uncharacterized cupin superfamily protein
MDGIASYFHDPRERARMANLNSPDYEERGVDGFRVRRAFLGLEAGAEKLGMSLWEVPPGQAAYPHHWHFLEEEIIVVLEGRPSLRGPADEWRELPEGEVVAFNVGPGGAHQIVNRTEETVRFLSISNGTRHTSEMCVYVDSNKLGAYGPGFREFYPRDGAVDYWDGEEPPTAAGSSSA